MVAYATFFAFRLRWISPLRFATVEMTGNYGYDYLPDLSLRQEKILIFEWRNLSFFRSPLVILSGACGVEGSPWVFIILFTEFELNSNL